ncbi:putative transient receptor potential-related channel 7 [Operophtera brumata]|uniref:Putative transient receptor potential-related channel 7 n=1 Tax=Operophtera brumata TaxID=104452 RepID=A0A0L7KQG4_OPEBR|nr:putative transient receptor potential-related channel 7 [Operophtera brumata]
MSVNNKLANLKWAFPIFVSILMIRPALAMIAMHIKCRGGLYPRSNVERFPVPDEKVGWSVEYKNYKPVNHSAPSLHGQPWADPEIGKLSYMGQYKIQHGYPLNPIGRTGIVGRGVLGRWGPNHGADTVFVAIKRGDTGEWALPGGMVDPGEKETETAVREFQEEAINCLDMTEEENKDWVRRFKRIFSGGKVVHRGYIDDHRNTDNAWIESVAYSFHDETGATAGALSLHAGDDAVGVQWVDITPQLKLYASQNQKVDEVYRRITNTK